MGLGTTAEKIAHFSARTERHINSVKKMTRLIHDVFLPRLGIDPKKEVPELLKQVSTHDASKYEEPEYTPYLEINWMYKCKKEGQKLDIPDDVQAKMQEATIHHIKNNRHHPEFHDPDIDSKDCLNPHNRDLPPKDMVDGSRMTTADICEMCADWMSVANELGQNPIDWANMNIGTRWEFSQDQVALIYKLLEEYNEEFKK